MEELIIYTDLDEVDHIFIPNIAGIYPQIRYDFENGAPTPTAKNARAALETLRPKKGQTFFLGGILYEYIDNEGTYKQTK